MGINNIYMIRGFGVDLGELWGGIRGFGVGNLGFWVFLGGIRRQQVK